MSAEVGVASILTGVENDMTTEDDIARGFNKSIVCVRENFSQASFLISLPFLHVTLSDWTQKIIICNQSKGHQLLSFFAVCLSPIILSSALAYLRATSGAS